MGQMTQAFGSSRSRHQLPLVGLFRCLYCGRGFGLKRELNVHYRHSHSSSIPSFVAKRGRFREKDHSANSDRFE